MCEAVIDLCSALFNISGRDLRSHRRCSQDVARVRQIAMYLCNTTLGLSLTAIGMAFGRDRTTVGHAVQLIEDLRDAAEFDAIMEQAERIVVAAFYHRGGAPWLSGQNRMAKR
ncbi:MAG: chromosomal replication initiator DnaA [Phyllobacteriaceae bacterium]|nr:chromosomal replication initiator DnaA [Phyllobacteriaceae bacterium]